jgi:hypothetical protein
VGFHPSRQVLKPAPIGALLSLLLTATPAAAGFVYGIVHIGGKAPDASIQLDVLQGDQRLGTLTVKAGGSYNIFLAPGTYTVVCPGGAKQTINALAGPLILDIDC